jgi:hypothetical protein
MSATPAGPRRAAPDQAFGKFESKFMLPWSFSGEAAAEKYMPQLQHHMWVWSSRPGHWRGSAGPELASSGLLGWWRRREENRLNVAEATRALLRRRPKNTGKAALLASLSKN